MTAGTQVVAPAATVALPARTSWWSTADAVYRLSLARGRIARGPLLFVATLQSVGILVLLRGVVRHPDRATGAAIVAGASILVVAFVALNLLAQRFGAMRAGRSLDYFATLPVPVSAVVLGTAASYATFTVPGALLTAVAGAAMFGLPFGQLWLVLPAVAASGVALSGVGAALGLSLPRAELATVAGQLGMTAVLFLGLIPAAHLPLAVRGLRQAVPSTYAVDVLAAGLRGSATPGGVLWRIAASLGYGAVTLAIAARAFRRAVAR
jgi:ABC-2 type transport system permease protein